MRWRQWSALVTTPNWCRHSPPASLRHAGATLPPRLPATADGFARGRTSLRHVEVITRLLNSAAAGRLSPEDWAGAEVLLAGWAGQYTPRELHEWGKALVETLDQDGAEPDDR